MNIANLYLALILILKEKYFFFTAKIRKPRNKQ